MTLLNLLKQPFEPLYGALRVINFYFKNKQHQENFETFIMLVCYSLLIYFVSIFYFRVLKPIFNSILFEKYEPLISSGLVKTRVNKNGTRKVIKPKIKRISNGVRFYSPNDVTTKDIERNLESLSQFFSKDFNTFVKGFDKNFFSRNYYYDLLEKHLPESAKIPDNISTNLGFLGLDEDSKPVFWDIKNQNSIYIVGDSGSGKTQAAYSIVESLLKSTNFDDFYVIDPKDGDDYLPLILKYSGKEINPTTDLKSLVVLLEKWVDDFQKSNRIKKQTNLERALTIKSFDDLRKIVDIPLKKSLIVMDELSLYTSIKDAKSKEDKEYVARICSLLNIILSQGRISGCPFILINQRLHRETMDFHIDNIFMYLLGIVESDGIANIYRKNLKNTSVKFGKGVFSLTESGTCRLVRTAYDPSRQVIEKKFTIHDLNNHSFYNKNRIFFHEFLLAITEEKFDFISQSRCNEYFSNLHILDLFESYLHLHKSFCEEMMHFKSEGYAYNNDFSELYKLRDIIESRLLSLDENYTDFFKEISETLSQNFPLNKTNYDAIEDVKIISVEIPSKNKLKHSHRYVTFKHKEITDSMLLSADKDFKEQIFKRLESIEKV